MNRREFCVIASLALSSACGSSVKNDGRLTARPRAGVKTTATGEIKLGLDSERDAIDRCGRRITSGLKALGYDVTFREFDGDHEIPGDIVREGLRFL